MIESILAIFSGKEVQGVTFAGMPLGGERGRSIKAELKYADGTEASGVAKVFSAEDNPSWEGAALKEFTILRKFGDRDLGMARIVDVRALDVLDFDRTGVLMLESEVRGEVAAGIVRPVNLKKVQDKSKLIFSQLRAVSGDEELISGGIAFCGDVSSANVVDSPRGYSIVDWSGKFDLMTPGYMPPELIRGGETLSFVHADTYGLGCFLARMLLGKERFRSLVSQGGEDAHLTFEGIKQMVVPVVHGFFKVALAEKIDDRSPEGATDPGEHYSRLEMLFGGMI